MEEYIINKFINSNLIKNISSIVDNIEHKYVIKLLILLNEYIK